MGLSATPRRPACPSRASGWPSLATQWGFPCCARFPCVHAAATTPVRRMGVVFALSPNRISLPRYDCQVDPHDNLFEVCTAFTCVAACTLALPPIRDTLSEGFSHFVSSMTAPVASGWSEFAGWGFHPLESAAFARRTSRAVMGQFPCNSRLTPNSEPQTPKDRWNGGTME